jgi:hypothetical protein
VSNPYDPQHGQPSQPWQPAEPWGPPAAREVPVAPDANWPYPEAGAPTAWLPPIPAPTGRAPKWPWIISAAAVVLALVLGIGGFVTYRALSGGGTQPEQVLPADTFAVAKIDLDPAAGQKIAALRFLHKLPKVGKSFDERKDPKQSIFEVVAETGQLPSDVSYDKDVKPWLGDRLAVAARPAAKDTDEPDVLVVVQAKDEGKTRAGVLRLTQHSPEKFGFAFRRGYAVFAKSQQIADRAVTDAGHGTLRDAPDFAADMKLLGEAGVSSGWIDTDRLSKAVRGLAAAGQLGVTPLVAGGRASYAIRFISGGVEAVVKARGAKLGDAAKPGFPKLADLPASTAAGISIQGTGQFVDQAWSGIKQQASSMGAQKDLDDMIAKAKSEFGVLLPDDLKTLLGSQVLLALDSSGLATSEPRFGARAATNSVAAAEVMSRITDAATAHGSSLPLGWKELPDGIVVANDQGYADTLANITGAKLGAEAGFNDALPDLAGSVVSGFVNLRAIGDATAPSAPDETAKAWLMTFRALGLTVSTSGDIATTRLRLLLR